MRGMADSTHYVLRARTVVPMAGPAIDDGAVEIAGNRLAKVGRWPSVRATFQGPVYDLGDVALLPGLIDAHTHLELTHFAGALPEGRDFVPWLQALLQMRRRKTATAMAASWQKGAFQQLVHGTTTVANIESTPTIVPPLRAATPLRVFSCIEMTGVLGGNAPEIILEQALGHALTLAKAGRGSAGLSPHAPYSTPPKLLRLSGEAARDHNLLLTLHLAESKAEFEMFCHRTGPLAEWLAPYRDLSDCDQGSPVAFLFRQLPRPTPFLAAHVNAFTDQDARLLGKSHASVVHCPRTHAYFGRERFRWHDLRAHGVNVCLGTDSLASTPWPTESTPELDLFETMRQFREAFPDTSPETLLELVTTHAARALGKPGVLGVLSEGAAADLITVPFDGPIETVCASILEHRGPVSHVYIDGHHVPLTTCHPQDGS